MSQRNDHSTSNIPVEKPPSPILVNSEDLKLARTSSNSNTIGRNGAIEKDAYLKDSQNAEHFNLKSTQISPNKIEKDLNAKTFLNINNENLYNNTTILTEYIRRHNTLSAVEAAILRSTVPIDINGEEEITINGHQGIWANKAESVNWKGPIPLTNYAINEDPNPEIITKKSNQQILYQQEVAIRYLRPPTPPSPGEIIIQQQVNTLCAPAPPLVIRQQPPRPVTPPPLVVREAPPPPPPQIGKKVITISGKSIPPPPRKVVIERLAPLPSKPQSVIIERWLPYNQVKRRVIFQKTNETEPVLVKPRNVIIQWEAPVVQVKKDFKDLGIIRANPAEYVARYGSSLKSSKELPPFVLEIKPPAGILLASDYHESNNNVYELEGDVSALRLIDLDREGLSEYKQFMQQVRPEETNYHPSIASLALSSCSSPGTSDKLDNLIAEIFSSIDKNNDGRISVNEAQKVLLRLNSRLGRKYGEEDVKYLFETLDKDRDGFIGQNDFKKLFQSQL